ncbi:hypothetical protein [Halomicrobium urmianum]|uniref:hypothetical protein n=1 Tax=Halomicrobium urmianum TaxID=1586233 RepID=UPI001CD91DD9|nr:hypothetical protein [Halomicrobium urmianum]
MPAAPESHQPYRKSDFPPQFIDVLANGVMAMSMITVITFYQPDIVDFLAASLFGAGANLYFHESIHYIALSRLGYDPIFDWPNSVWAPNVALSVKEGIIHLISPQILTVIYIGILFLTNTDEIAFMVIVAIVLNLAGGFRDVAWAIRRLLWPKGHLVLVDSKGNESVSFQK